MDARPPAPGSAPSPPAWGPQFVISLYSRYATEVPQLKTFDAFIPSIGKSYGGEERRILYLMVRQFSPGVIFEVSPKRGWSTLHMAAALERNGGGQIVSFELDPLVAWAARRTLRRARLAHRAEIVVGDVREQLPRAYERLRKSSRITGIEFLFIDADHGAEFATWYLENLFPLVKQSGVIHIHDIEATPQRVVNGEAIYPEPSGEEKVLAEYLVMRAETYRWFSVAEAVRDEAYISRVRRFGGGDLSLPPAGRLHAIAKTLGFDRNPSLWVLKVGEQETSAYPYRGFEPLTADLVRALERKRRFAFLLAPLSEMRRSVRRAFRG